MLLIARTAPKNLANKLGSSYRALSAGHSLKNKPNFDHERSYRNEKAKKGRLLLGGSVAAGLTALYLYENRDGRVVFAKEKPVEPGVYKKGLPIYTLEEILQHTEKEKGIWVTYKEGVYDITKFVSEHPGGEQILIAAGSSVEPFWVLYAIHNNPHVFEVLESLRIGNVSKEDARKCTEGMSDPYSSDPKRHPLLKAASEKPYNAEPPLNLLAESFITPNELFYVRNHLPVPVVDGETYQLEVEIEGENDKTHCFTLDDLKKLPPHKITSTVMCAGNRRSEMTKVKPVKGLSWGAAAVGTAEWTGVRLRDVLKLLGVDENDERFKHVQFEGLDIDVTGNAYGASIPFWKAIERRGDVLLAYEMNGQPIPADHGFPVRVIVPGNVGARNVKWVGRIVVSGEESQSHWQQNDYKGFSPSSDAQDLDYSKSHAIQELPVVSAICTPLAGETVEAKNGHVSVKGYAWSGGGQRIARVDVTVNGGEKWYVAELEQTEADSPQHWSWTLWRINVPVEDLGDEAEIWVKAVDTSYNSQPETFQHIWNPRGVLSNAYHRVPIKITR